MLLLLKIFFCYFFFGFHYRGVSNVIRSHEISEPLCRFVRETVIRRETTELGKRLAIRMQGLIYITGGALFALFIWAVM